MTKLKSLFLAIFTLLYIFSDKLVCGVDAPEYTISYEGATTTGVYGPQQIQVTYDKKIYDNKEKFAPIHSLLQKLKYKQLESDEVRGFDKKRIKTVHVTTASFASQIPSEAGGEVILTLAVDEKNNMIKNQHIQLLYNADLSHHGELYTRDVYVSDKVSTTRTTIKVKAINPELLIGVGYTGTDSKNGDTVASGIVMNCLSAIFGPATRSVTSVSWHPFVINNFVTYSKWPYEGDNTEKRMKLFTEPKTKKMEKNEDAQSAFLELKDKEIIWGGNEYVHKVEYSSDPNVIPLGPSEVMVKGKGLEYWLLNGGGPAIKAYENDIRDDAFYTALEYWLWSLYDPGLSDQAKRRLGVCNQAFVRYLTQLKVRHPGIKIEDNDKIGIPGVRTIHLDAMVGTATMDMIVHRSISELYNNRYQPYCMALTWPMIQPYVLEPDSLFTNIQETDFTGYKDEFRGTWSYLLHNAATPYHGLFYPAEPVFVS
jgi:hypothetical protein